MQRARSNSPRGHRMWMGTLAIVFVGVTVLPLVAAEAKAATLDRVRQTGKLTLGYRTDARPFAFKDEAGNASGYSVALCQKVAEQVKSELGLATLKVEWVPVTLDSRYGALQQGSVDVLCGAETATLARRKEASFSIPTFPGGIGAIVRSDSSRQLRQILTKGQAAHRPLWRATPAQFLEQQTFSIIQGTTSEKWLAGRIDKLHLTAKVVPVESYDAGIRGVLGRNANVFFGDRAILLDAAKRSKWAQALIVLDRRFTAEAFALALQRGDEDFRLVVDRALSRQFMADDFALLYAKWFGEPDEDILMFFHLSALPEQ